MILRLILEDPSFDEITEARRKKAECQQTVVLCLWICWLEDMRNG